MTDEAKDILEESFQYIDDTLDERFEKLEQRQQEAFKAEVEPVVDVLDAIVDKLLEKES